MKTPFAPLHSFLVLLSALTFFAPIPVAAQTAAPSRSAAIGNHTADIPPNPFGAKSEPSEAERAAAKAALTEMAGTATPAPVRLALDPVTTELRQLLLQRFDKTGSGTLNAAEVEAARKVLAGRADIPGLPAAQAAPAAPGPLFGLRPLINRLYDKNGDGVLDANEMAAIRAVLAVPAAGTSPPTANAGQKDLASLSQDIIKHFSANGTGQLTNSERAAAKAWLQQMMTELDKAVAASTRSNIPQPSTPAPAVRAN